MVGIVKGLYLESIGSFRNQEEVGLLEALCSGCVFKARRLIRSKGHWGNELSFEIMDLLLHWYPIIKFQTLLICFDLY